MSYNRFLELLIRKKAGELSPAEQEELSRFLSDNPEFSELTGILDDLYDTPFNRVKEVDKAYLQQRWNKLQGKLTLEESVPVRITAKTILRRLKYAAVAASVAAILISSYFYLQDRRDPSAGQLTVVAEMGSKKRMTLPDGSTVWLNGGSKISYDEDDNKHTRDVYLSGEAYFDVVHDATQPFIVHTSNFNIKVLGTAFNVKAYAADEKSEASLVRGLIELSFNNGSSRKIMLHPNEKLTFRAPDEIDTHAASVEADPEIVVTQLQKPVKDSIAIETQWMHDRLAFKYSKLKDVALQISRWYDVVVEIKDHDLENKEFSGIFEHESVEEVMEALKLAGGFDYAIDNDTIIIK